MSPPIEPFTSAEIIEAISRLNPKNAARHDVIGNKAIKELSISNEVTIATFADDTALLATHAVPAIASSTLQRSLDSMEMWFQTWGFKINEKNPHI